jgi:hypothetical protein
MQRGAVIDVLRCGYKPHISTGDPSSERRVFVLRHRGDGTEVQIVEGVVHLVLRTTEGLFSTRVVQVNSAA